MSDTTPIWMPLYIKDYLANTQRLSTLEHGAYLLLIMDYWITGRLDDDDEQMARITKMRPSEWRKIKPKIISMFVRVDEQFFHPRIEEELANSKRIILDNKVRAAKAGAATKLYWQKRNAEK